MASPSSHWRSTQFHIKSGDNALMYRCWAKAAAWSKYLQAVGQGSDDTKAQISSSQSKSDVPCLFVTAKATATKQAAPLLVTSCVSLSRTTFNLMSWWGVPCESHYSASCTIVESSTLLSTEERNYCHARVTMWSVRWTTVVRVC